MKKERLNLDPRALVLNNGSVDWLPANPRTWTQLDIDRTSRSIAQDPDFLEDRPILVVAEDDMAQYVVFAGNLRTTAAKGLALKSVPVVVYYPETDADREAIKRRAMKDNGTFGSWDYDALANEWDDLPLAEFGVPVWDSTTPTPATETEIPEGKTELGEAKQGNTITLTFSTEQYAQVVEALLAFGGSNFEECVLMALGLYGEDEQ